MNAKNHTCRLYADFDRNRLRKALPYSTIYDSAWPWRWRANNKLGQDRVSLKCIYVWGVNSTVTKHSDYFVWKDTSECVARRCDDHWQEASEFLWIKTPLLEGVEQPKIIIKNSWKCSVRRAANGTFSKFRGWRHKKNKCSAGFHAVCRYTISLIWAQVDSEARIPKITMTVRVDIFTKSMISKQQSTQTKNMNQICDSHPDSTE